MLDQTLDQLMFLDAILAKRERISSDHFNFRSLVLLGLGDHFHFPLCPGISLEPCSPPHSAISRGSSKAGFHLPTRLMMTMLGRARDL